MRVLVVWVGFPEEIRPYVIENPTEEQLEVLKKSNEKFINIDRDVEHTLILSTALGSHENADPTIGKEWHALWEKCSTSFPVEGPIDLVVCSGYYM